MAVYNNGSFVDLMKTDIQYSSSDNSIATVNSKGLVEAKGTGVVTISATVGRVTGSTVFVVK